MTRTHRFAIAWCAHGYLRELVLIYPVYAIMMGERGISPFELSTLFIIWGTIAFLLEVPSGVLADRVSRKWLIVVSGAIKGSAYAVWLAWPSFEGFALGFALWGTGSSLISGTAESLLHDTLAARGEAHAFARVYGWGVAANQLGVATSLLAGGYLAESGFTLPLALSALAPWAAALVVALAIDEPPRARQRSHDEPFFATLAAGWREVRSTPALRYLVAALAALPAIHGSLEEYSGPYLAEKPGLGLGEIGLVYALAFAARAVGIAFAHRIPLRAPRQLAFAYALSAAPLAATLVGPPVTVALLFALYFTVVAGAEVLLQAAMQRTIEGHARATVTSLARMGLQLSGIALYLAIGGISEVTSFHGGVAVAAVLSVLLGGAFALRRRPGDSS